MVDHIVVSNKEVAKIYTRRLQQINNPSKGDGIQASTVDISAKGNDIQCKFYFNIGSVESFEDKLEEAQQVLGLDPHDHIPVTYESRVLWGRELLKFAPTLLFWAVLWGLARKMQGGFGIGGSGGSSGARGIFNIGKAHVTKMDKNSKNKVEI